MSGTEVVGLGKGTSDGKAPAPSSGTGLVDAGALLAIFSALGIGSGTSKGSSDTTTTNRVTKLTKESVQTLLNDAKASSGYTQDFTPAQLATFLNDYNKQAQAELDSVIQQVSTKITPATDKNTLKKTVQTVLDTSFPSFLDPTKAAKDFIWKITNFGDEKTLGGKALKALQSARSVANAYGPTTMADATIQEYARRIAKGELSIDDFKAEMTKVGVKSYPQFADAFARTPGATMYDLANPYINQMAKTLELDPNSIKLDNPLLDRALRPDGTAGKLPSQSLADFNISLMNTPAWENTTAANHSARNAAVGLGRAMGMGV